MTESPNYRLPWQIAFDLGRDVLFGNERSFLDDCTVMVGRMRPRPQVTGLEHIPQSGPFALVANHYEGPGLWIGWTAALLTYAVGRVRPAPVPLHWLVIGAMDRGRVRGVKRLAPGTGWFFARVARTWGMIAFPRPDAPAQRRAMALRRLLRTADPAPAGAGEPVGLFPEGEGDGFEGLRPALPGTGLLLAALARRSVPALPAAVWAQDGRLHGRFGPPWLAAGRNDLTLRAEVMARIAALTPLPVQAPEEH